MSTLKIQFNKINYITIDVVIRIKSKGIDSLILNLIHDKVKSKNFLKSINVLMRTDILRIIFL